MEQSKPIFVTQVAKQGKITIPANLRKKLRIEYGDWVTFEILNVEKPERRGEDDSLPRR